MKQSAYGNSASDAATEIQIGITVDTESDLTGYQTMRNQKSRYSTNSQLRSEQFVLSETSAAS